MPLWIVIYLAGHVVSATGPLPYDMEECRVRASEFKHIALAEMNFIIFDGGFKVADMEFKCEYHYRKPNER